MEKYNIDEEEFQRLSRALPETPEEIQDRIDLKEREAGLIAADASILKEYEKRVVEIEKLEKELATVENELANRESTIEQLKNQWLLPLRKCIVKLNGTF